MKKYFKAEDAMDVITLPEMHATMGTRAMTILKTVAHC